jgi:hypothetical protein
VTRIITVFALLVLLEIIGRILYPISREARSKREAGRDHRRGLPYLGVGGNGQTLLRDLYLMEKRYVPFLGWLGAANTRLSTVETNAQGFRDRTIESRKEGEYRILVTGGSFAWGVGASCNAMSVAGQLEGLLNQCGSERRYRVMNGAFLNWSSRHEYVVVTEFFDTFDPDLVISLSGYNDLVSMSKGAEIDTLPEARMLAQAVSDSLQPMGTLRALRRVGGTLGAWRIVVLLREVLAVRAPPPQQFYNYDQREGPRRVERAAQRYRSIAAYLARNGRDYLVALEPEIYSSKKPLTIEEFDLKSRFMEMDRNILPTLTRYRKELSNRLAERVGERFLFLDLADVYDNEPGPVFIDYNHVCDRGSMLVAQALVTAMNKKFALVEA